MPLHDRAKSSRVQGFGISVVERWGSRTPGIVYSYMYIFIYIYTCTKMYIYLYKHIYIFVYCFDMYMCTCIYLYITIRIYLSSYLSICISKYGLAPPDGEDDISREQKEVARGRIMEVAISVGYHPPSRLDRIDQLQISDSPQQNKYPHLSSITHPHD